MKFIAIWILLCLSPCLHAAQTLESQFESIPLITIRDQGGALLPVRIDGMATHLLLSSTFDGIVLSPPCAKAAKLRSQPNTLPVAKEIKIKEGSKAKRARIDLFEVGSSRIVARRRGLSCLVVDHQAPPGARLDKVTYPCGGSAGADVISELGLTLDFSENKLYLPKKGTNPGSFAFFAERNQRVPVLMVRDRRTKECYLILKYKRKELAFLLDLQSNENHVDPGMAHQLNLPGSREKKATSTSFPGLSLGPSEIAGDEFLLKPVPRAGQSVNSHRVAGRIGINFLKKHKLAIDFSGPVAMGPPLDQD